MNEHYLKQTNDGHSQSRRSKLGWSEQLVDATAPFGVVRWSVALVASRAAWK
jgi:hypothetical protein